MAVKYLQAQHPNVAAELARRNLAQAEGMWFTAFRNSHISLEQYRSEVASIRAMRAELERKGDAA